MGLCRDENPTPGFSQMEMVRYTFLQLRDVDVKWNVTDLMNEFNLCYLSINPCAGGLGEALRPPMGGLGGSPPSRVFLRTITFRLSQ
ncbi:MAG: hypothetical protein KME25_14130 [Symplocastrum torsivum CPER-KK1]|jgi:hypothetical protein|uniref:Uncharacterized protein n=1 Tax=Symplocastrum torsivum CPER-KK1 TaxID=450513 RepID=A0A951UBE1_9CYAN|nr:hypothetical protein [Symplocastrum torsivum CPER-KK1]